MENHFHLRDTHYCYGESNLRDFGNLPCRMDGGMVLLCVGGTAVIQVGLLESSLAKNRETVILPGTVFRILETSEDFFCKMFVFSKEIYGQAVLRPGISLSGYLISSPFYQLPEGSDFLKNAGLYMEMAELVHRERHNEFIRLMQCNFVQNYFLYLYDKCLSVSGQAEKQYTGKQKHFYAFLSLLDRHIKTERKVAFYAEKLFITSRYLGKITAENTLGESPKELIDRRLVLEIKVLLQCVERSIQQIADGLNFPDQSYLSRYFKHHTGISPSEYRNEIILCAAWFCVWL
ncbi:MAG: helix-turn-helix domain-containing protein [Tannerella sp.]|jgi:AraC-like DNA-binding protein|nr:helix-turn-helix domain-containing protein [Tannerella sp.]